MLGGRAATTPSPGLCSGPWDPQQGSDRPCSCPVHWAQRGQETTGPACDGSGEQRQKSSRGWRRATRVRFGGLSRSPWGAGKGSQGGQAWVRVSRGLRQGSDSFCVHSLAWGSGFGPLFCKSLGNEGASSERLHLTPGCPWLLAPALVPLTPLCSRRLGADLPHFCFTPSCSDARAPPPCPLPMALGSGPRQQEWAEGSEISVHTHTHLHTHTYAHTQHTHIPTHTARCACTQHTHPPGSGPLGTAAPQD